MIELKNIDLSYGEQKVLSGFSFTLADGEKATLMGRSGVGKTSVMKLILGLIRPDSGSVTVPKSVRFGAVFQEDRLIEELSAVANCRLVLPKKEHKEKVRELLLRLGLDENISIKPVCELSGGERRRVTIARALLAPHGVLLLDEPFKGIDAETLPAVIAAVAEDPSPLLLITHSPDEAAALGCRIVTLAHSADCTDGQ